MVAERRSVSVAVLISGPGTTLANLIERIGQGRLPGVRIAGVISSRAAAGGVEIARRAGLPVEVVARSDYPSDQAYWDAISAAVDRCGADLVLMAGFLSFWKVPPRYEGRVLNIHPALLPQFGGRGMYGRRVHEAVLAAGAQESGCTVHLVDNEYDHGPIVAQRRVPVLAVDTPETLAARVAEQERELYPWVLSQIVEHGIGWLQQAAVAHTAGQRDSQS